MLLMLRKLTIKMVIFHPCPIAILVIAGGSLNLYPLRDTESPKVDTHPAGDESQFQWIPTLQLEPWGQLESIISHHQPHQTINWGSVKTTMFILHNGFR